MKPGLQNIPYPAAFEEKRSFESLDSDHNVALFSDQIREQALVLATGRTWELMLRVT